MRNPFIAHLPILAALLATGQARGQLTVAEGPIAVTVASSQAPTWKVKLDGLHGGVVSALHLPADGPSIVATEDSVPFRGFFNTFFMTVLDGKTNAEDRVKAKGTFWRHQGNRSRLKVLSRSDTEVIVETRGTAGGWRLLGPDGEPIVEYRQTLTFRPDRIVCDGEMKWIYGYGTRLKEFALEQYFAPGTVSYPVLAGPDGGMPVELPITSSKGTTLPAAAGYPPTLHVTLKNGHRVDIRVLEMPAEAVRQRWYNNERPWQQDWAQYVAVGADHQDGTVSYPPEKPIHYRYEMLFAKLPASETPPRLTITSPQREQRFAWGGTIDFAATATDAAGKPLPADSFDWRIHSLLSLDKPDKTATGARTLFTIPASKAQMNNRDAVWAVVSAKDAQGRVSREYVKVDVREPSKPFAWKTATPESQGMSSARLAALKDSIAAKSKALLVVRNDKIVYEWYAADHSATTKHGSASLAKAVVGGLSLAVALTDGRIGLTDKAALYIPQWRNDPRKSRIEIRHLGSHTSGLEDAEENWMPHNQLTGWKGDFWKGLPPPHDPFTIARDLTPVMNEVGTKLRYSNPAIGMLTYAVTETLRDAPQKDARMLLRDRIMRPIGVPDAEWTVGYGKTPVVDGLPLVAAWGGASYTARALARIGRLIVHDGVWDGTRLLSTSAVRQVTTSAGLPGNCGMGWWTNSGGRYAKIPRDAMYGAGGGDQVLLVIPSLKLIMVRNGSTLVPPPKTADPEDNFALFHDERAKVLFEPLIEALKVNQ